MANRIQYRRDTAANWTSVNPVLALGEPGYETDTKKRKIGDGATAWTALAYQIDTTAVTAAVAPKLDTAGLAHLSRFHAGLASITTRALNHLAMGDSITERAGSTGVGQGYVDLIRDFVQSRYNPLAVPGGKGYVMVSGQYPSFQPAAWTLSGGATIVPDSRAFGGYLVNLSATGHTMSITFTGTGIVVIYNKYSSVNTSMSMKVDGVDVAKPDFSSAGSFTAQHTISGLTNASHTLVISNIDGGAQYYIIGGLILNGDTASGWRLLLNARSGSTVYKSAGIDLNVQAFNPDLTTIYYGTNEYRTNVPVATFKADLLWLVNKVLSNSRPVSPIVLVQGYTPQHAGTPVAAWTAYRQAVKEVAAETGVLLADLFPKFGEAVLTSGLMNADGVHPTAAGHALISDAVLETLKLK